MNEPNCILKNAIHVNQFPMTIQNIVKSLSFTHVRYIISARRAFDAIEVWKFVGQRF